MTARSTLALTVVLGLGFGLAACAVPPPPPPAYWSNARVHHTRHARVHRHTTPRDAVAGGPAWVDPQR